MSNSTNGQESAVAPNQIEPKVSSRKVSNDTVDLKNELLAVFPNGIDHGNMMDVIVRAMRFLTLRKRKLTGQQKKKLIIDSLLVVLDETDSGSLEVFEPLIKTMIPTVVDNLIDVEKGKIRLNKKSRSCVNKLTCGCCC